MEKHTIYFNKKKFNEIIFFVRFQVTSVVQFVDGCVSQYKGRKGFLHLTLLGLPVCRYFFVMSHGKSPSDSLGVIIKRMASGAILHGATKIHSGKDLYGYCQANLTKVGDFSSAARRAQYQYSSRSFMFVSSEEMAEYREERREDMRTVPSTRKFHSVCTTGNPSTSSGCVK